MIKQVPQHRTKQLTDQTELTKQSLAVNFCETMTVSTSTKSSL